MLPHLHLIHFVLFFEEAISAHGPYRAISYISYFWPPEVELQWISSMPNQVKKWKASHILLWESSECIASTKSSLFSWFHFRVVLSFFVLFFDVFPFLFGWLLMLRYNGIWLHLTWSLSSNFKLSLEMRLTETMK